MALIIPVEIFLESTAFILALKPFISVVPNKSSSSPIIYISDKINIKNAALINEILPKEQNKTKPREMLV